MTFALIALLLLAQAAAERPANPVIEGRVLRAGSGEPVKKAQVALLPAEGRRQPYGASTDETGGFAFRDIEPGRYRLFVERNGFVRQEYGQRRPNRTGVILTLERGQHLRDVVLRLVPSGVVAGRIVDEDGEPLADAAVRPLRYGYRSGRRQLLPFDGVTTNDLGEYRIHGLNPGRYYLSVRPRQTWEITSLADAVRAPALAGPEQAYAPTYFPGTVDPLQASPLDVGPGAELSSVDIRLSRTPTVRVRGKVFLAAGGPAQRAVLTMTAVGSPVVAQHHVPVEDPEGTFEIRGVTTGSWVLVARSSDGARHDTARVAIEVGRSHLEDVQLVLSPDPDLAGRVLVEGNGEGAFADLRVSLQGSDSTPFSASGAVKADGTFLLPHVPAGRYFVSLVGQTEDYYLKDARLGQVDVLDGGFDVDGAAARFILELVVSAAAGRVEGTVLSERDQAVDSAQVVLAPESARRHLSYLYKTASSDEYGRFNFRGIAPGDYRLFAWEDLESGAWRDPEFLKLCDEQGESISVREGRRSTVKLKLIRAEPTGGPPGSTAATPPHD